MSSNHVIFRDKTSGVSTPTIPPVGNRGHAEPTLSYYSRFPRRERMQTSLFAERPYPLQRPSSTLSTKSLLPSQQYNTYVSPQQNIKQSARRSLLEATVNCSEHLYRPGFSKASALTSSLELSENYSDLLDCRIEELQNELAEQEEMNIIMTFLILDTLRCHVSNSPQYEQIEAAVRRTLCDGNILDRVELAIALPQFVESCRLAEQLNVTATSDITTTPFEQDYENSDALLKNMDGSHNIKEQQLLGSSEQQDTYKNLTTSNEVSSNNMDTDHNATTNDNPTSILKASTSSDNESVHYNFNNNTTTPAVPQSQTRHGTLIPPLKNIEGLGSSGWLKGISTSGDFIPPDATSS